MSHEKFIKQLNKRFPNLIVLPSNVFNKDSVGGLWLKNASCITYTKKDLNTICAIDNGLFVNYKLYDIDVYNKFSKWCKKRGYYCSTSEYTLMVYPL
jgi:hypothetical protein